MQSVPAPQPRKDVFMGMQALRFRALAIATVLGATALGALPASAGAAELIYGLTWRNELVSFTSQAPSQLRTKTKVSGLQQGEALVGMDSRPINGQVVAVSNQGRLYVLNLFNGATRQVSTNMLSPLPAGQYFGMDVDPVGDDVRLVSDARQNLRIHPETAATQADGELAYATSDPGAGSKPAIVAAGYTNNVFAATTSDLYVIDAARDVLAKQDPDNAGTLFTRGALGVKVSGPQALDIAPDNTAYAALRTDGEVRSRLYRLDLASGTATPTAPESKINAPTSLAGIVAVGALPDDSSKPAILSQLLNPTRSSLRSLARVRVSCNEACTFTVTIKVDGQGVGSNSSALSAAGQRGIRVQTSSTGMRLLSGSASRLVTVQVQARDATGNANDKSWSIRL